MIGTSGTILSLGTVATADRRRASDDIRNLRVSAKQIHRLRKEVTERSISERMKLPGLDPRRADLIVAGGVLLDTILSRLERERHHAVRFRAARRAGAGLHPAQPASTSRRPIAIRTSAGAA